MKMKNSNASKKNIALIIIISALISWGFDFIALEYVLNYVSSGVYTLIRLSLATVIFFVACMIKNKRLYIAKKDIPRIALSGIAGMSLYFTIESVGISMTSASFSSLVLATVPIFGVLGDRIVFKKKITVLKSLCILVSIVGVYLLVMETLSGAMLIGLLVILVAAMLWTFQIIYLKPMYDEYDLLTILAGLFVSATIFQLPLALLTHPHIEASPQLIVIAVVTTIVCIVLGQAGYVFAIGHLSVTTVSSFENMVPVVTIILSFIVYGTMLSPIQIVGALLIIGSVTLLAFKE